MTTGNPTVYLSAIQRFMQKLHDWEDDDHYVALLDSGYTPDLSHSTWADVSANEVGDADYSPQDITGESTSVGTSSVKLDCDDFDFGSSVTIAGRYAVILEGTAAGQSGTDNLFGYILLDDTPADVSTTNDAFVIALGADGLAQVGNGATVSVSGAPYDLTDDQYNNQNLFCAWRAESPLMGKASLASEGDYSLPVFGETVSTSDDVDYFFDASKNGAWAGADSTLVTFLTAAGGLMNSNADQAVRFSGTNEYMEFTDSQGSAFSWLWDDTVSFTIIFRLAITRDIAATNNVWLGNRSGSDPGMFFGARGGRLQFLINDGTSEELVQLDPWSGFVKDQLFTFMIQHTQGGSTSLFVDDLGTAVATNTITTWSTGTPSSALQIGARNDTDEAAMELCGYAFFYDNVLTEAEANSWDAWIQDVTG